MAYKKETKHLKKNKKIIFSGKSGLFQNEKKCFTFKHSVHLHNLLNKRPRFDFQSKEIEIIERFLQREIKLLAL